MKDIARLAGVSLGTVSRVLNGAENVKGPNAQKVFKVVDQLGYRPSSAARNLAKGAKSYKIIGVLIPHLTHPFYFDILKGIQVFIEEQGHNLMVFNLGSRPERTFDRILGENLDGLLVLSYELPHLIMETFKRYRIPIVYVDREVNSESWTSVDNYYGGQLAAQYMIQKGVKKAAYIGERTETPGQLGRRLGFFESIEKAGLPKPLEFYTQQGEDSAKDLSRLVWKEHSPEGFFFFCDEMAYGGLSYFQNLPKKPVIVGYDDLLPSKHLGLTTIHQPSLEMGSLGAEILFQLMEQLKPDNRIIRPTLMVRNT